MTLLLMIEEADKKYYDAVEKSSITQRSMKPIEFADNKKAKINPKDAENSQFMTN